MWFFWIQKLVMNVWHGCWEEPGCGKAWSYCWGAFLPLLPIAGHFPFLGLPFLTLG